MEINIETLYDVGDKFFFLHENKFAYFTVTDVTCTCHKGLKDSFVKYEAEYRLVCSIPSICTRTIKESELQECISNHKYFTSKKLLANYVLDNL